MILLTGGAGFIGSCFLKKLNNMNITDILVVDRLGSGDKWKNLVGKRFRRFEEKSIFRKKLDNDEYAGMFEEIIHLGACSDTMERNADYLMDNNFSFSVELAKFADWYDIRLIYASSAATYGDGSNGYSDSVFESLRTLNCYGFSKHAFDMWVLDNNLQEKFSGLKFFNVFGPNEYHKDNMSSMIFKAFNQIKETGKVKLFKSHRPDYKDGEQKRDFIYVKDVTEVMWNIYCNKEITGIYNLGTGYAKTWNELMNAVFQSMGRETNIEYIDMPDSMKNQYQYFTQAEMGKLEKTGTAIKFRSLEDSVSDYVRNYLLKEWQYL